MTVTRPSTGSLRPAVTGEAWTSQCRMCDVTGEHPDRAAAYDAALEHAAATGHLGAVRVGLDYQVWEPAGAAEVGGRAHHMWLAVGAGPLLPMPEAADGLPVRG